MGGGASKSVWTEEEKAANEYAVRIQKSASEYIVENIYYNIPVKISKKNQDPTSPVLIEVTEEVRNDKKNEDMLKGVPSVLAVSGKGEITATFLMSLPTIGSPKKSKESEDITYKFNFEEVEKYISDLNTLLKARLHEKDKIGYPPEVPMAVESKTTQTSLELNWKFPQSAGIVIQVELQYSTDPTVLDIKPFDVMKCPSEDPEVIKKEMEQTLNDDLKWHVLICKDWSEKNFQSHTWDKLNPGTNYYTRMRTRTFMGWSPFSVSSKALKTLAGPPSPMGGVEIDLLLADVIQLHWNDFHDGGSPILEYELRARSIGEEEFTVLYQGLETKYTMIHLIPENTYSFEVAARNSIGMSPYCDRRTVTTPKKMKIREITDPAALAGYNCKEAWREMWDPKSEQSFYFNQLTGTRQLKVPECLIESATKNLEAGGAKSPEVAFRMKRFKLVRSLKKRSANVSSPTKSPVRGANTIASSSSTSAIPERTDIFPLKLHRNTMLADALTILMNSKLTFGELCQKTKVTFIGEAGIDSGGLTKELFILLSKDLITYGTKHRGWLQTLPPNGDLFFSTAKPSSNTSATTSVTAKDSSEEKDSDENVMPVASSVEQSIPLLEKQKLTSGMFARFMGRFIGKALFDRMLIDIPLSPLLLQHMVGEKKEQPASPSKGKSKDDNSISGLDDLKIIDETTYKSLIWMMENNITDIIYETFSVNENGKDIPLCKDGEKKDVTEENKLEYVKLMVEWRTHFSIRELLDPFLQSFHELIPKDILVDCQITPIELDLLLNGKPNIDVDEIRAYCIFQGGKKAGKEDEGFGESSEVVEWLWRIIRSFDQDVRRNYLKFVTGTSRVPLDGYDPPFNITEGIDMEKDSLPKAHTCFNQLVIPPYSSCEVMKERLLFAINNTIGFDLS